MRRLARNLVFATVALVVGSPSSLAVVYLADTSLESMIVKANVIFVGKVTRTADGSATVQVTRSLKGDAAGEVIVHAAGKGAPRLAQDQRALVFLQRKDGQSTLLARMPLRSDAEEKTILACYSEILPHAEILHRLADAGKEVDLEKVRAAVKALAASRNAFTQIILGRLMDGPLTERVNPSESSPAIEASLKSPHTELVRGAARWAGKSRDRNLLPALQALAGHKDSAVKKLAREAIERIESAPANQPETQR